MIHSLETGAERTYQTKLGTTGGGPPLWFHDNKSIATGVQRADGSAAYRIDVATGDFTELPFIMGLRSAVLSPDDKAVYGVRMSPNGKTSLAIVSVDLGTGKESRLFTPPNTVPLTIAASPDGRTLALGWQDGPAGQSKLHIARVGVEGAGYREVGTLDQPSGSGVSLIKWSSDGRSILFDKGQRGGVQRWNVMRVPADGSVAPSLVFTISGGAIQYFDVSPDGSRYIYSASENTDELWALDNVLPMLK